MIEDMKGKIANVNVAYYINLDTVRAVEQAVGVQLIGRRSIKCKMLFKINRIFFTMTVTY